MISHCHTDVFPEISQIFSQHPVKKSLKSCLRAAFIFHLIQLWQTLPFPNVLFIFIWWVVINLTDFWNSAKNREPTRDNLSCKIQFWRVTFSIHPVQTTRMTKVIWRNTRNGMNRWSPQVLKGPWRTLDYYKFRVLLKPSK